MTVKQQLEKLQDPDIKKRALKNLQIERAGDRCNSAEHAIYMAFYWHNTPEQLSYWQAVHHNLKYPNDLMPLPKIK